MEEVPKEMVKMWKTSWENYVKTLTTMQDQSERMFELFLSKSDTLREEAKKLIKERITQAKEAQKTYLGVVEENFRKIDDLLSKKE